MFGCTYGLRVKTLSVLMHSVAVLGGRLLSVIAFVSDYIIKHIVTLLLLLLLFMKKYTLV